jgi:hypothetical protein
VTASTELLIGDAEGQHVLVRAHSRHHPHLFDYWDGNWISSDVDIVAGGMRAAFRAELRSEEFQSFLDEAEALNRSLDGVATFSTAEGQLTVTLTGDPAGRVRLAGEAADAPGSGNRLHFAFEIDQSYLPQICRQLQLLLEAFPVVGATESAS